MKRSVFLMMAVVIFLSGIFVGESKAVAPPSVDERSKAEAGHKKEVREKVKEQRASGCEYGRDKATGKCYEPKEGQFYRDPATGEVRVKKIKKINTPW